MLCLEKMIDLNAVLNLKSGCHKSNALNEMQSI